MTPSAGDLPPQDDDKKVGTGGSCFLSPPRGHWPSQDQSGQLVMAQLGSVGDEEVLCFLGLVFNWPVVHHGKFHWKYFCHSDISGP